jgi:hypothetical protein
MKGLTVSYVTPGQAHTISPSRDAVLTHTHLVCTKQEAKGAALAEEAAELKAARTEVSVREAELARRTAEHAEAAAECRVGLLLQGRM